MMAFLTLEDLTGSIEVIVFPKLFEKLRDRITQDSLVIIRGRLNLKEEELPKVICEDMEGLELISGSKLYIKRNDFNQVKEARFRLKEIAKEFRGNTPIFLFDEQKKQTYKLSNDFWVDLTEEVFETICEQFGNENVKVVEQ